MVAVYTPLPTTPEALSLLALAGIDRPSEAEVESLASGLACIVGRLRKEDQAARARDREAANEAADLGDALLRAKVGGGCGI